MKLANKNAPVHRMLKGYTIDPGFSTQLNTMAVNESVYKVRWEELAPGPIGEYVEVIDFDPSNNCFYEPVNLDSKEVLAQHGLTPSEGNAKFHQQFVYAIVMQTIENFERALGRKIIWRSLLTFNNGKGDEKYVARLRVYPHALRDSNAYYASEKVSLLFGYFQAANQIQGSNFPGGVVFTCLSPDIVAHETTHAILDSILPRYLEDTNPDVPAFHEAFADIVALLQRFSHVSLVEHQLEQTRGRLDEYSVLGELATQFGLALETGRGALRSAIGQYNAKTGKWQKIQPDPTMYANVTEAHDRGAILVATIFDAFLRLYNYRIKDLLRIATQGSGILSQGAISHDLVKRLAAEASEIASHLLSVCIRALDYCPPFDITFGDYLRALITADRDICPTEDNEYRVALIEAFRAWGIFPKNVNTLSVYSLAWKEPDFDKSERAAMNMVTSAIKEDVRAIARLSDREKIFTGYKEIQRKLHNILTDKKNGNKLDGLLMKMGLTLSPFSINYKGKTIRFDAPAPLEVHSVRPAFRIGKDNTQIEQVIITLTQSHRITNGEMKGMKFRGGCTIVMCILNDNLNADYIVVKNINSGQRLESQFEYQTQSFTNSHSAYNTYLSDGSTSINFEKLHLH